MTKSTFLEKLQAGTVMVLRRRNRHQSAGAWAGERDVRGTMGAGKPATNR